MRARCALTVVALVAVLRSANAEEKMGAEQAEPVQEGLAAERELDEPEAPAGAREGEPALEYGNALARPKRPAPIQAEHTEAAPAQLSERKVAPERAVSSEAPFMPSARLPTTKIELKGELSFWLGDDEDALDEKGVGSDAYYGAEPRRRSLLDGLTPRANRRARQLVLGITAQQPTSFWNGSAAAHARLRFEQEPETGRYALWDYGSRLELRQCAGGIERALSFFPINGDGLRAGWLEALAWGGEAGELGESPYAVAHGVVPAVVLRQRAPRYAAWLGVKGARFEVPNTAGLERERLELGALGGAELSPFDELELRVSGGALRHGAMTQPDVRGQPLVTFGASARVVAHVGLRAFELTGLFPAPIERARELAWALGVEGAWLEQRMKLSDTSREVRFVSARGGAVFAAFALGRVELLALGMVRELGFVARQGPGVLGPEAPPRDQLERVEWTGALEGRLGLTRFLTGALAVGVERPAFLVVPGADGEVRALVVRGPRRIEVLPRGEAPAPELEARAVLSSELSAAMRVSLFVEYRRAENRLDFGRPSDDSRWQSRLGRSDSLGYGLAIRADL